MRVRTIAATALTASVLVGCAGGGARVAGPKAEPPNGLGTAHLRILVPARAATTAASRHPTYVSPSTASILIQVGSVNGVPENPVPSQEVDLTASNTADCSPPTALAPLTCTVPVAAPIGTDLLTLTTFDQTGAAGNVLSINSISTTIVAGTSNTISVTLVGVPVSVGTLPLSGLTPTGTGAYTMTGATAQLLVEPLDADANVIVGPGAPQLAITNISPANVSAAFATATGTNPNPNPNLVNLTKLYGSTTSAVVSYSATPPQNPSPPTSSGAGGGVSATFSVLAPLDIYVAEGSSVQQFVPPGTSATGTTAAIGAATQLGHDGTGREYALIPSQTEVVSWSGGTSFPNGGQGYAEGEVPIAMAVAANGGLAFLVFDCCGVGLAYFPPGVSGLNYSQFAQVDTATSGPVSAAFDATGTTLYVATKNGIDKVTNVPTGPSSTQVSSAYTSGQIATDTSGNVFVDNGTSGVVAFGPSNFTTPAATYAAPSAVCPGAVIVSAFAVASGSSLATDTLIIENGNTNGCYNYQTYPTATTGSAPAVFSVPASMPALAVTGGGTFVLGAGTTVSAYPSLWGTASFTATAGGTITAIDVY